MSTSRNARQRTETTAFCLGLAASIAVHALAFLAVGPPMPVAAAAAPTPAPGVADAAATFSPLVIVDPASRAAIAPLELTFPDEPAAGAAAPVVPRGPICALPPEGGGVILR